MTVPFEGSVSVVVVAVATVDLPSNVVSVVVVSAQQREIIYNSCDRVTDDSPLRFGCNRTRKDCNSLFEENNRGVTEGLCNERHFGPTGWTKVLLLPNADLVR